MYKLQIVPSYGRGIMDLKFVCMPTIYILKSRPHPCDLDPIRWCVCVCVCDLDPIRWCVCVCVCISRSVLVCLFVTPRTAACQASLSMELSRQEYWSGLPFPSPEELPNPGNELWSPASQADSLPFELQGSLIRSNKITVLIKRDTRDLVCSLSATWGHHEKAVTYKPWKEASEWKITCWHLDLRRLGF